MIMNDDGGGAGSDSEYSSAAQSGHNTVSLPGSPESSESHSQNDDIRVRKWKIKEILAHFWEKHFGYLKKSI